MASSLTVDKPSGAVTVTHRTWTVALTGGFEPPVFRLHTDPAHARETFEAMKPEVVSPGESVVVIEQTVYSDRTTSDTVTAAYTYADRMPADEADTAEQDGA